MLPSPFVRACRTAARVSAGAGRERESHVPAVGGTPSSTRYLNGGKRAPAPASKLTSNDGAEELADSAGL